jgi:anti-anti-sigma factor
MPLFDVQITETPGGVRLALSGEIDMSTIDELRRRTAATLAAATGIVVLDLGAVTFLDSSGLRLTLQLNSEVKERGGRFVVVPGDGPVSRLFELTGASAELEIAEGGSDPLAAG